MAVEEGFFSSGEVLAAELAVTAQLLRRSTVAVRTRGAGGGSGTMWRPEGLVITNAHVVREPQTSVELWDGRVFEAQVVARDPRRDLAALRIDAQDLPAASIGDSDALRVGQLVVAVGNPLGLAGALTLGILHAIAPAEDRGGQQWVQADIRLAPGNSGGPMADALGRVIGINSMIAGGLGLAVPSNDVERFIATSGERPHLGVTLQPVRVPAGTHREAIPGLIVLDVESNSAADSAGLMVGDVIIGFNGKIFSLARDMLRALQHVGSQEIVQVDLVRGGRRQQYDLTLVRPADLRSSSGQAA